MMESFTSFSSAILSIFLITIQSVLYILLRMPLFVRSRRCRLQIHLCFLSLALALLQLLRTRSRAPFLALLCFVVFTTHLCSASFFMWITWRRSRSLTRDVLITPLCLSVTTSLFYILCTSKCTISACTLCTYQLLRTLRTRYRANLCLPNAHNSVLLLASRTFYDSTYTRVFSTLFFTSWLSFCKSTKLYIQ